MKLRNEIFIFTTLLILVAIALLFWYAHVYKKPVSISQTLTSFSYGTLDGYFTGQESITYPLIFSNIRTIHDNKVQEVEFGPQVNSGFQIYMTVSKMTRKNAENDKLILLERGAFSEGKKTLKGGYIEDVLSYDLRSHPDLTTQACNFSYISYIPLAESANDLVLDIQASDPQWDSRNPNSTCSIYSDQNYKYLRSMMDTVMLNIAPAF